MRFSKEHEQQKSELESRLGITLTEEVIHALQQAMGITLSQEQFDKLQSIPGWAEFCAEDETEG